MSETIVQKEKFKSMRRIKIIKTTCTYFFLALLALTILYPLYLLLNISLKSDTEFANFPTEFVKNPQFGNYAVVFESMEVFKRFFTTVWMTAIASVVGVGVCAYCAFPLQRNYFRGASKVFTFIIVSMYFPGSLVANIVILNDVMNVYGTPIALILLWIVGGMQMNVFMFVGFLKSVPKDLDEAAFVDGCSYVRYVFTVAIPLMKPIVFTILLTKIIGCWNDFLGPYIYVTDPEFRTLSTGLFQYKSTYGASWNYFTTAIFIVAFPIIIIYIIFQKYIISGMIMGAVKG
ncbi:MAG: carbohydrate ABC transporter permease [Candidatus Borkfalkiaceae bacterium]|nr:carbohydrate ABC transporter permease [Clostridia bacterium]MDY6222735.1 carbohydrate ABC transporter permease [Christensenellaceae bacterium]